MKDNLANIPEVSIDKVDAFYVTGTQHRDAVGNANNLKLNLKTLGGEDIDLTPRIKSTNPATNIPAAALERYGFTQEVLDGIFSGKITALRIFLPNHNSYSTWHIAVAENAFGAWHIEMCPNSYVTRLIYDFDGSVGSIQRDIAEEQ